MKSHMMRLAIWNTGIRKLTPVYTHRDSTHTVARQ